MGLKVNVRQTSMNASGTEKKIALSKIDPCGKKVESNAVWCTPCKKWIHARCTKTVKVSCSSAQQFVCRRC